MSAFPARRLTAPLAALATLALLGCGSELDFDDASLPTPSITLVAAPETCSAVGPGSLDFGVEDARATIGFGASTPVNRLTISGVASGLGPDDRVFAVVLAPEAPCAILETAEATLDGAAFDVIVSLGENVGLGSRTEFLATVVAHAGAAADIACDEAAGCLSSAAGGFSAVSETVALLIE